MYRKYKSTNKSIGTNEHTTRWHLKSNAPGGLQPKHKRVRKSNSNKHTVAFNDVSGFSNEHGHITSMTMTKERSTNISEDSSGRGRTSSVRIKASPPADDIRRRAYLSERLPLFILRSYTINMDNSRRIRNVIKLVIGSIVSPNKITIKSPRTEVCPGV